MWRKNFFAAMLCYSEVGPMKTAIEFRNIKKTYGEKVVMERFNLSVEKGEFVTIIGSSGCGKTTALKMVNGLIQPTSGDIFVDGENIRNKNQTLLRRNIGYAIQGSVLFPHMTVEQNIAYVPNLLNKRNKEKTKSAVSKWMKIVGLSEDLKHRYPSELSGGQQQRVGIARALAASPDILLMDEPFGAVDEITRGQLQTEMKRIHQQTGYYRTVCYPRYFRSAEAGHKGACDEQRENRTVCKAGRSAPYSCNRICKRIGKKGAPHLLSAGRTVIFL